MVGVTLTPKFFVDQNGTYYEAITETETPPGHTAVDQHGRHHRHQGQPAFGGVCRGARHEQRWKTASGEFVTLTAPQIIALALAVRAHVQACFDREADLAAQIRAAADPAAVALTF